MAPQSLDFIDAAEEVLILLAQLGARWQARWEPSGSRREEVNFDNIIKPTL